MALGRREASPPRRPSTHTAHTVRAWMSKGSVSTGVRVPGPAGGHPYSPTPSSPGPITLASFYHWLRPGDSRAPKPGWGAVQGVCFHFLKV